jgi:hypothetical protein
MLIAFIYISIKNNNASCTVHVAFLPWLQYLIADNTSLFTVCMLQDECTEVPGAWALSSSTHQWIWFTVEPSYARRLVLAYIQASRHAVDAMVEDTYRADFNMHRYSEFCVLIVKLIHGHRLNNYTIIWYLKIAFMNVYILYKGIRSNKVRFICISKIGAFKNVLQLPHLLYCFI